MVGSLCMAGNLARSARRRRDGGGPGGVRDRGRGIDDGSGCSALGPPSIPGSDPLFPASDRRLVGAAEREATEVASVEDHADRGENERERHGEGGEGPPLAAEEGDREREEGATEDPLPNAVAFRSRVAAALEREIGG